MQNDKTEFTPKIVEEPVNESTSLPNESGSFYIDGICRIFDPNTEETLVEIRA
jgi:hypothetical protein